MVEKEKVAPLYVEEGGSNIGKREKETERKDCMCV